MAANVLPETLQICSIPYLEKLDPSGYIRNAKRNNLAETHVDVDVEVPPNPYIKLARIVLAAVMGLFLGSEN